MKKVVSVAVASFMLAALIGAVALSAWNSALAADSFRAVQVVFAQAAKIQFGPALFGASAGVATGVVCLAAVLALTLLFGQVYCRVLCPLGIVQNIVRFVFRKHERRVCSRLPQPMTQRVVRWSALALVAAGGAIGSFAWCDPYAIFFRFAQFCAAPSCAPSVVYAVYAVGMFAVVVVLAAYGHGRFWCNWICPVGTILSTLSKFAWCKDKIDARVGCGKCMLCVKKDSCHAKKPAAKDDGDVTRRGFLAGSGAAVAAASAEKIVDGGFAPVCKPGVPERKHAVLPPGATSDAFFSRHCVGCQLCVAACPEKVLRPSSEFKRFMLPEMGFENGWCQPNCTACSQVCPASAIRPLTVAEKRNVHVGHAIWHKDRCIAATEGVICSACSRNCPQKAIYRIPLDQAKPEITVPFIDKRACVGCGACENLCPVRPMPAITVKGFAEQRDVRPISETDTVAEAKKLVREGRASVVVIKDGVIVAHAGGRGVSPLLELFDEDVLVIKDAIVVDKIVGRAVAAICVAGGAKRVEALTFSDDAAEFLAKCKVAVAGDEHVPQILNRKRDGICPLEQSVKGMDDPAKMLAALRRKINQLKAKK